ncbi:hypothetical protein EMIT0194MI4_80091 [Pseudomonas sp. IT-194MI4]
MLDGAGNRSGTGDGSARGYVADYRGRALWAAGVNQFVAHRDIALKNSPCKSYPGKNYPCGEGARSRSAAKQSSLWHDGFNRKTALLISGLLRSPAGASSLATGLCKTLDFPLP